jgi:hypothetical protein
MQTQRSQVSFGKFILTPSYAPAKEYQELIAKAATVIQRDSFAKKLKVDASEPTEITVTGRTLKDELKALHRLVASGLEGLAVELDYKTKKAVDHELLITSNGIMSDRHAILAETNYEFYTNAYKTIVPLKVGTARLHSALNTNKLGHDGQTLTAPRIREANKKRGIRTRPTNTQP